MTLSLTEVRAGCEWQRELCRKNGSSSYVALITELLDRLGTDDTVTGLLTADDRNPIQSALCLRLFGAVNRIAMAEDADWLGSCYPTFGGTTDVDALIPAFFDFLTAHDDAVRVQMKLGVQTNEVGRAAPLSAAMNVVAALTGRPLRLLEVGASAGLNLLLDRYFVAGGRQAWGPPESPLRLTGHFESGEPPAGELTVAERRGCDLNPLDVHAPGTAELLRSFVWPEHVDRARRLDAALQVARSAPRLAIDAVDACSWLIDQAEDPVGGRTTVIYHSIVLPYFDPDERTRFESLIRERGAATDADRPLAWISLEPRADDSSVVELHCELWPQRRRIRLARTTPHGTHVRWDPQDESIFDLC
ncbi:Aminoacyl-tRNA hydrolase [Micromonospora saelicesensis]|uniref:Aminoacyl-tRNA hydrolase n=1 Tax=Micromonospora saelicesensis TaxID=285676 RepID=A0ABX9CMB8_9ACTN|nr:DUF2332 domain-containing protein [Micromonospora saelicesensis]RAO01966.1 Aminoacyl-tRNA hydrolase [Micromonospora saelicesensis]RAO42858.1 Aminoacyl-tRNA hydrolase [Micromonospora saelicesensis]RAO57092.1 Aminoacyl-tRNA hydrolase [Micromonospora saelicesensis]